ncbi:hypothetical protein FI667_g7690, partial [Globisporangium splendens]
MLSNTPHEKRQTMATAAASSASSAPATADALLSLMASPSSGLAASDVAFPPSPLAVARGEGANAWSSESSGHNTRRPDEKDTQLRALNGFVRGADAVPVSVETQQQPVSVPSSETEPDAAETSAENQKTKKPKKVRKRTYYMRKEEKEILLKELHALETRMAYYHEKEDLIEQWKRIRQRQHDNRALRNAIRSQRLGFANAHCMMTQFMQTHDNTPFETYIKLGLDPMQRRASLLALKQEKLEEAITFLTERGRFLDPSKSFVDTQRFENAQGDYCSVRFDLTPFEGLQSARQVFDKYLDFAFNLEISISETLGDITIREDDDVSHLFSHDGIAHNRLMSRISNIVELDINNVMFSQFFEDRATDLHTTESTQTTSEMGVLVFDFVDDDERYPYFPNDRVRQDVTSLVMVTSFKRKKFQNDPRKAPNSFHNSVLLEEDELVVVMMRWSLLKVHRTDFYIPEEIQQRIRHSIEHVADAIITTVRQAVYTSTTTTT